MPRSRCTNLVTAVILLGGAAVAITQQPASPAAQAPGPGGAVSSLATIDLVVLDSNNRPVTTLAPGDVRVTVDGEARAVVGMQYVVRGRGALTAARSLVGTTRLPVTAEATRLVVLAIDEDSITRGSEKVLSEAVGRVIDNLATADQVLLVPLPGLPPQMAASVDRGILRDGLARVVGRAVPETALGQPAPVVPQEPTTTPPDDEETIRNRGNADARLQQQLNEQRRDLADPAAAGNRPGSPEAIGRLFDGMRRFPGQKTVIVFSGGEHGTAAGAASGETSPALQFVGTADAAVAARVVLHAVHVARTGSRQRDRDLERLAVTTGGRAVSLTGGARDLDPIDGAMAGSYLVQVERRPEDDRRLHGLRVTTTRRGATVVAAARWAARDDAPPPPLPEEVAAAPPTVPVAPVAGPVTPARWGFRPAPRRDPELDVVLARVTEYLQAYIREFSNVVAEEVYLQHINLDRPNAKLETRRLRSDLLIVQVGGGVAWVPFRDVFEVDGSPVRDREERLQQLFLTGTEDAIKQATQISNESARHNLGPIRRTVNIPTLALEYLLPNAIARSNFVRRGEENAQGVRVLKIDFEEWGSPTVIKTGNDSRDDYPASGSIWVEPLTGRIIKTRVRAANDKVSMESTVLFGRNDAMGIWTPVEMKEVYEQRAGKIGGDAKYSKFRRFQVTTEEAIKVPK